MRRLKSSFPAMTDGQNYHSFSIVFISDDIGALAKFDDPLANLWRQVIHHTAYLGVFRQWLYTLVNSSDRSACSAFALGSKKRVEAGHIYIGEP